MITIDIFYAFRRDKKLGFKLIYRVCREPLAKFAFRSTHRNVVAYEIVRDAFLLVWKKRRWFKSGLHIQRFLYRTVLNRCRTENRKIYRLFGELPPDLEQLDTDTSELALLREFAAYNQWVVEKIRLHLAQLPAQQAQDFQAFIFDRKRYKDIARQRGTTKRTVHENMHTATNEILKYLDTIKYPGYSINS